MTQDDIKLFEKIANNAETRQILLRHAKEVMPEHPAVKEQKILDEATKPLLDRINKLEDELTKRTSQDRYEVERNRMKGRPYNFNDAKIQELEERMTRAAKEEGVVFDSYAHAAEYIRKMDMPLGPSSVSVGFGVMPTGQGVGQEKWRTDMLSNDKKENPAMMSRRDRRNYVRKLAREASDEFKANLG